MKPDTVLTLVDEWNNGIFNFSRYEVPEKIGFGGEQKLAVHELVGGVRVVDAMGRSDAPLEWSGLFQGETALERARYLDGLRAAGGALRLSWSEFDYQVVIQSFTADYQRRYQIPYRIACVVVENKSSPITTIASAGIDGFIRDDMSLANGLADGIGDGALSGLMGGLNTAISTVSDFAKATASAINSVLQPIADVRARVGILFTQVNAVTRNVTTLGGILPNNPIAQQASRLMTQANAHLQAPQLHQLDSVLGRMQANIGTIRK